MQKSGFGVVFLLVVVSLSSIALAQTSCVQGTDCTSSESCVTNICTTFTTDLQTILSDTSLSTPTIILQQIMQLLRTHLQDAGIIPSSTSSPTPPPTTSNPTTTAQCDTSSFNLNGVTHYFCDCQAGADADCQTGNDAQTTFTNPNSPGRTAVQALRLFNTIPAGDTIAFCEGGSFSSGEEDLYNYNCRANQRCAITSYSPTWASGDEGLPKITFADSGIQFENPGLSITDGGYVLTNLELRSNQPLASQGVTLFNDVEDLYMCNLRIDGFAGGVVVSGSNSIASGDGLTERIVLEESQIINNANQGWIGGCNDCVVQNNYFENNGHTPSSGPQFSHSIYANGAYGPGITTSNMRILGNEIRRSVHANGNPSCGGSIIVVHGIYDGLQIVNNKIHEQQNTATGNCYGIEVTPRYVRSFGEQFDNIVIRNNVVEYVAPGNAIVVEQCTNCITSPNTIR